MTYYVATDGDDENPGTLERPWRTIQKAADSAGAGDTVYVREGTYREHVVVGNSGRQGSYVTFAAYPEEAVTVDGKGIELEWRDGLLRVADREYVRVLGLRVVRSSATGIMVRGSQHVVVEDCYTCDTANSGIGVWRSSQALVKGNEVAMAVHGGSQECITIAGSDHVQVIGNDVHDGGPDGRGGEGIDAKDGCSYVLIRGNHVHNTRRLGIYVDAWKSYTHDIEVAGNVCHDCAGCGFAAASERGGLLENVRFVNNIAYRNKSAGIAVAGWNGEWEHPMRNIQIVNNTCHNNGWKESAWGGGIAVESLYARDVLVRNNICSGNRDWQIQDRVGRPDIVIDHNLIDEYRGHETETRGEQGVEGDALFVNAADGDFRLRPGSPAIDTGSAEAAPGDDFDGVKRPQGSAWDMGAFEYVGD